VVTHDDPARFSDNCITDIATPVNERVSALEYSVIKKKFEILATKPQSDGSDNNYGPAEIRTPDLRRVKAVS
jgi:hypothetical protein